LHLHIPRVMLHAASLVFLHPLTNAPLTIRSPWPEGFVACLNQLRSTKALA
jgi:hypothetical protein